MHMGEELLYRNTSYLLSLIPSSATLSFLIISIGPSSSWRYELGIGLQIRELFIFHDLIFCSQKELISCF